MKKTLVLACAGFLITLSACNNNSKTENKGTHTHEDGSTHDDHDTTKPVQKEFKVTDSTNKADTGTHKHADGTTHSHDDKNKDKHD
jgi:protein involved in sex pheromone biosynthesis